MISLRRMITYYNGQSAAVANIFYAAVHETAIEHYSPEQINAWAPLPIDYDYWRHKCELKRPFLYVDGDAICGFIEFDPDGHIDCHYIAPEFSRQGVGGKLLLHVLNMADSLQLPRVYVEASHLAKGLYLKHGFRVVRPNQAERGGVVIENWIMERTDH